MVGSLKHLEPGGPAVRIPPRSVLLSDLGLERHSGWRMVCYISGGPGLGAERAGCLSKSESASRGWYFS